MRRRSRPRTSHAISHSSPPKKMQVAFSSGAGLVAPASRSEKNFAIRHFPLPAFDLDCLRPCPHFLRVLPIRSSGQPVMPANPFRLDRLDHPAPIERAAENLEGAFKEEIAQLDQGESETSVRLVAAESVYGVAVLLPKNGVGTSTPRAALKSPPAFLPSGEMSSGLTKEASMLI